MLDNVCTYGKPAFLVTPPESKKVGCDKKRLDVTLVEHNSTVYVVNIS